MSVEVADDQRNLVVHWLAGAPAFERYPRAEIVESSHTISVVPIGEDTGPPGARTAVGYVHRVPAILKQPLGSRVVVDLNGNPQPAISQTHPQDSAR